MSIGRFQLHLLGIHRHSNSLLIPPEFSTPSRIGLSAGSAILNSIWPASTPSQIKLPDPFRNITLKSAPPHKNSYWSYDQWGLGSMINRWVAAIRGGCASTAHSIVSIGKANVVPFKRIHMATSTVKFLNQDKGFGFITPENGGSCFCACLRLGPSGRIARRGPESELRNWSGS